MSTIYVIVEYNNDTEFWTLACRPPESNFEKLREIIKKRWKISPTIFENLRLKYEDEDKDWITINCDSDLQYAHRYFTKLSKKHIPLHLHPISFSYIHKTEPEDVLILQKDAKLIKKIKNLSITREIATNVLNSPEITEMIDKFSINVSQISQKSKTGFY